MASIHWISSKLGRMLCVAGVAAATFGFWGAASVAAQAEGGAGAGGAGATSLSEKSFTKPSQDVDLDFSAPGLVS